MTPDLWLAVPVYDDFSGVALTVQSARLHHRSPRLAGVVVCDNRPDSDGGKATAAFCRKVGARYLTLRAPVGTAAAKDAAVRACPAGSVAVLADAHVLFRPKALKALAAFYDARPGCPDLVHPRLLHADLGDAASHMDDRWSPQGLWGTFRAAWRSPAGVVFDVADGPGGRAELRAVASREPVDPAAVGCRGLRYDGHGAALFAAGCRPPGEPFEVPAQATCVFAVARDHWPGFAPGLAGYGGEEGALHAKFRRLGRRVWSVPGFDAWHRQAEAPPADPRDVGQLARNYVRALAEAGVPLAGARDHFVGGGKVPATEWDRWAAEVRWEAERRGRRCLHLGARAEFRAGCPSGWSCRHACDAGRGDPDPDVTVPGGWCRRCPAFEDDGPF